MRGISVLSRHRLKGLTGCATHYRIRQQVVPRCCWACRCDSRFLLQNRGAQGPNHFICLSTLAISQLPSLPRWSTPYLCKCSNTVDRRVTLMRVPPSHRRDCPPSVDLFYCPRSDTVSSRPTHASAGVPLLGHIRHLRILSRSLEHDQPSGPRIASPPSRHLPPDCCRFSPSFPPLWTTTCFLSPSARSLPSGQESCQGLILAVTLFPASLPY